MNKGQLAEALVLAEELCFTLVQRGRRENISPEVTVAALVSAAVTMRVMLVEPAVSTAQAVTEIIAHLERMRAVPTPEERKTMS